MKIKAKEGQCLVDIALMTCGTVESVLTLCERNGMGLTDDLHRGDEIEYDLGDVENRRVVEVYRQEGVCPATGLTKNQNRIVNGLKWTELIIGPLPPIDPIPVPEPLPVEVSERFVNVFDGTFDKAFE